MSQFYYPFPVQEFTSRVNVLRIAAEYVEADMRNEKNPDQRDGCCTVFARMRDAISAAPGEWDAKKPKRDLVYSAQAAFEALYKDTNRAGGVYWMGTRANVGMKRRITALLTTAEAL